MRPLTRFDAERIQFILRRHGWTAYAYDDGTAAWKVVCHWPGDEDEEWERGIQGAWRTIKSLGGALDAIIEHSAKERRETA